MSLFSKLLGFSALLMLIAAILYVVFGQVTVRKLRKNPETKDKMGVEFASGWDILNVAGALSRPKWLTKKFNRSTLSGMAADSDVLYKHTSRFDRLLARIFWAFYVISGTLMISLAILNLVGIFD